MNGVVKEWIQIGGDSDPATDGGGTGVVRKWEKIGIEQPPEDTGCVKGWMPIGGGNPPGGEPMLRIPCINEGGLARKGDGTPASSTTFPSKEAQSAPAGKKTGFQRWFDEAFPEKK